MMRTVLEMLAISGLLEGHSALTKAADWEGDVGEKISIEDWKTTEEDETGREEPTQLRGRN